MTISNDGSQGRSALRNSRAHVDVYEGNAQRTAAEVTALRQRAEQGDARAQYALGLSYNEGRGVPQDDAEAHKWRTLAAS